MDSMLSLSMLVVALTPKDVLLDKLQTELFAYQVNNSEETFNRVAGMCQMILTKGVVGDDIEKARNLIDDFDKSEKTNSLLNTTEQ